MGKTEWKGNRRYNHHIWRSRCLGSDGVPVFRQHVYNWIRVLCKEGLKPDFDIIEEAKDHDSLIEAEKFYVEYLRFVGFPLTNLTPGGEGCVGYKHTKEAKARMSLAKKGVVSPMKGKSHTVESRLAVSTTKTGLTREQQESMVKMYQSGLSGRAVAKCFGVTETSVRSMLNIFGVNTRNYGPCKVLTNEQEAVVVKRYLAGESAIAIAKTLPVSDSSIRHTLKVRGVKLRTPAASRWLTARGVANV